MTSGGGARVGSATGAPVRRMGLFAPLLAGPAGAAVRHALYVSSTANAGGPDRSCLTATNALGEGFLASGVKGTISDDAITANVVEHNNLGCERPTQSRADQTPSTESVFFPIPRQGSGFDNALVWHSAEESSSRLSVADSFVVGEQSRYNSGEILPTDETGPTHRNLIADSAVIDNTADCGITVPGRNPPALSATGKPQPVAAGDYDSPDSPRPPAPPTGPRDLQTTGVMVFSGGTPISVTITSNRVYRNHFGVWTSSAVTSAGLCSNTFFSMDVPLSLNN